MHARETHKRGVRHARARERGARHTRACERGVRHARTHERGVRHARAREGTQETRTRETHERDVLFFRKCSKIKAKKAAKFFWGKEGKKSCKILFCVLP